MKTNLFFISAILLILAGTPALSQTKIMMFYPEFKIDPVAVELVGDPATRGMEALERFDLLTGDAPPTITVVAGESLHLLLGVSAGGNIQIVAEQSEHYTMQFFRLGFVGVPGREGRFYPDILIPFTSGNGPLRESDAAPAELFPAARKLDFVLLEIEIPGNIAIKTLDIPLRISIDGVGVERSFRVQVLARPLPPSRVELDFNEYGDKYLRPFLKQAGKQELRQIEQNIFQMAKRHGGALNPLPYKSQRGVPRKGMAPGILNDDLLHPQLDWEQYDARFGPLFSGEAFDDGQPISHFYLPFNPNWPAPFSLYKTDREKYEAIWKVFAREFLKHFENKGWTRTTFQVYCNQKPAKNNRIPWHLDEPKSVEDYRALRYYADLTHAVFPADHPVKVRFRIDISHFYCDKHRGHSGKDFRVNGGAEILQPVDIWVISAHSLRGNAAAQYARELIRQGKEVWLYSDTPTIFAPGPMNLEPLYFAWQNRLIGLLIWKSFAFQLNEDDGGDFIFYALTMNRKPLVLSSLRAKLLKRAIDDTRLIAAGKGGALWLDEYQQALSENDFETLFELRKTFYQRLFTY